MGSAVTSVGSTGGKNLFTFSDSGQDTGSLHPEMWEASRWGKWLFQLTGTGTGYAVTLYGTIDIPTAYDEPGNNAEWFEIPSPSTEAQFQWANPMSLEVGQRALQANAHILAFRAVSSTVIGGTITGTVSLQVLAAP
jgi:hypothetical protein